MVSFRGNSIHAPSRDPSVLPSEARVTCGAALSWRGSPERTSSLEKGFLSLPRPECFLRLSFFNALMEMKSLRMKTTDPDKGGITNYDNVKATQRQDGDGEAMSDTRLLSHVHVSRTYVLPETIRPSSATECVNTRGPGVWSLSRYEVTRVHGGRKGGGGGGGGDDGGRPASILRNNLEIWTISRRNAVSICTGVAGRRVAEIVSGKITGDGRFIDVETITIGVCPTMRDSNKSLFKTQIMACCKKVIIMRQYPKNYPSPIMIRLVPLLASPSIRIGELLFDMTRPEPDGEDQTDSRIPLRLCTSPGFPRDILRPPARKLPSNNHEKNR
ncbi:hypothetical protein G5I_07910 [Acromyrmex echinatior]|uniref:Uncharacterized protein n=1 Tax=Acromyrmex echinatior TaxID=103372 RepID=F4WQ50_ACREC|nr:hypothetical protein G5I_07910 [Acromyrmex echinatior]